jgi:hypothetical protein
LPHPAPKVALMFLVRGNMPLEAVWREFFAAAAQVWCGAVQFGMGVGRCRRGLWRVCLLVAC